MNTKSKLEDQVQAFWKDYLAQGDWRHAWPPYFLHRHFGLAGNAATSQCSDGAHDHGIDGFHYDEYPKILWLYQGKFSAKPGNVVTALQAFQKQSIPFVIRCLSKSLDGAIVPGHLQKLNNLLMGINGIAHAGTVDSLRFVALVTGLKEELNSSAAVEQAREAFLESDSIIELADTLRIPPAKIQFTILTSEDISGEVSHRPTVFHFDIDTDRATGWLSHGTNEMMLTCLSLGDLVRLYDERGPTLFHKNVRYFKGEHTAPARQIREALKKTLVKKDASPEAFVFFHSGLTLSCDDASLDGNKLTLMDPYVLNGCQTITTVSRFLKRYAKDGNLDMGCFARMAVPARVVRSKDKDFMAQVTINNNRQNALPSWSFRANDDTQIDLEIRFRDELKIFYERQEESYKQRRTEPTFAEEYASSPAKPIKMPDLAQWLAAALGMLRFAQRKSDIFERDEDYFKVFAPKHLANMDLRVLLAIWKIGQSTTMAVRRLAEQYVKYEWVKNAKFLSVYCLAQVLLQHKHYCDELWDSMDDTRISSDFREMVFGALSSKVRPMFAKVEFAGNPERLTEFSSRGMVKEVNSLLWTEHQLKAVSIWKVKPPAVG